MSEMTDLAAIAGTVLTAMGGVTALAFNKLSGATNIGRYTGEIRRIAEDYALQAGLDITGLERKPLDGQYLNSLFLVTSETAGITLFSDGVGEHRSVRLNSQTGRAALMMAHGLLDRPAKIFNLFGTQLRAGDIPSDFGAACKKEVEIWSRPSRRQAFWGVFSQTSHNARATSIQQSLGLMARVLSATLEDEVDLSGRCHIALRTTNQENGRTDVIVMPTTRGEWRLMQKIEDGEHPLPDNKRTAEALRSALVKFNEPATDRLRRALKL